MWSYEHTAETAVPAEQIWAVLSDIDGWTAWDTSLEAIAIQGPFAGGTEISLTPTGQEPITATIAEIVEHERYADRTDFGGVQLLFAHTLTRLPDGGTQVVHRLEISGPAADQTGPEIGPAITEDFPDAMRALIAHAAASQGAKRA